MSFRPRKKQKHPIGTKISINNGQVLTSTGVHSLDELLGGGLPMSSVLLLKEDRFTGYSTILFKYFIAQGLAHSHHISLFSKDLCTQFVQNLMGIVENKSSSVQEEDEEFLPEISGISGSGGSRPLGRLRGNQEQMKIAWRYQNMPQSTQSTQVLTFCNVFDLTKRISSDYLKNIAHVHALDQIADILSDPCYDMVSPGEKKVARIGIHSFASPMWEESQIELQRFIRKLKMMIQNKYAVVMITCPAHLYQDFYRIHSDPFIRKLEHACDAVIEIESFAGSPQPVNELYTSDYHGLLHPHKLFQLHSFSHTSRLNNIELHSLGFKLRRKRFAIEPFHIPPELEEAKRSDELDF